MDLACWQGRFEQFLLAQPEADAAHDLLHIRRVVANVRPLAASEQADMAVVLPAAWLHDCVAVAKDSPQRPFASRLAAAKATEFLAAQKYPAQYLEAIAHAIEAHSFSAKIPPRTIEAKAVQDADRLDSLGAVGIARCFITSGVMGRPLYYPDDPFCRQRQPDDMLGAIDHFYTKLLTLAGTMQTKAGKAEAERRTAVMRAYLAQLEEEIRVETLPNDR